MRSCRQSRGITLIEVLVILAVLAMLTALLVSRLMRTRSQGSRISCANNVKQVGLAYRIWAGDHDDLFPMHVSTNNGGTMEWVTSGQAWPHYQVMSNELSTPYVIRCFSDFQRTPATNFTFLRDTNISYFVGTDANEDLPDTILSGDRNLTTNGVPLSPGLFVLTTNTAVGWSAKMHRHNGNIGLSDGSVQQGNIARLQQYVQKMGRTNRLAIP